MVINHIFVHLKETKKVVEYLQNLIKLNPVRGLWMVSFVALVVSPFLTNDGVCLLFVEPILNAFESVKNEEENTLVVCDTIKKDDLKKLERSDAIYFLLALDVHRTLDLR